MGRSLPTIRPARPEDAGFIARNILSAQCGPVPRGWFDIALDRPEPECLAFVERVATARRQSWWHVSQFIIAEVDGRAGGGTLRHAGGCWVQGGDRDWLLEHVASLPSHRGRGLVQALIDRALEAGRVAGFSRASISFLIGNDPAERCYAKAGFAFAEEKRDPAFEAVTGAPGFRRFERAI